MAKILSVMQLPKNWTSLSRNVLTGQFKSFTAISKNKTLFLSAGKIVFSKVFKATLKSGDFLNGGNFFSKQFYS